MDYFLSASSIEPGDARASYSERLVCLNRLPSFYEPPSEAVPVSSRSALGLPETGVLYGCPRTLFKLHPDFDAVLADIAERDPDGHLVLIEGKYTAWSESLRARWAKNFPILLERALFLPRMPEQQFLALLEHVDVLLDTVHFGSGLSFYEAMLSGTPVVTWPGNYMRGRIVTGAYWQMGVSDPPIAASLQEYASIAVGLAHDPERLKALRETLKVEARKKLFADLTAVREFEEFLEAAVAAAMDDKVLPEGWQPRAPK